MLKAEGTFILPDNVPANEFSISRVIRSQHHVTGLSGFTNILPISRKQDVLRYSFVQAPLKQKITISHGKSSRHGIIMNLWLYSVIL